MPAIGYVRVSTEDQAKEGVSLDNQKSKIVAYCQLKDLDLSEIIEDAGISAKNLKRPGVQRVLKLARTKQVDAIVVYKLDRIFRSTTDALETTKLFEKWAVSFHSIEETLDTQSAMGRFFFTLTAALAEMEMLDAGELPGWVQKMMGHETLQMIHDRYYSYNENYQRDDGIAFMENVYNAVNRE